MKKITFFNKLTFLLLLLIGSVSYSQERTCGMVEYMEEKMKDPKFEAEYIKLQNQFKAEYLNALNNDDVYSRNRPPILIPVAVHFPTGSETDRACLEALAQNQVDILNADYTATNSDISNWSSASSFYPGTNTGVANVFFCLATMNHPTGTDTDLVEGGPAVTIGYNWGNGGDQDTNWSGYMNFVVRPIGGGILGYSPLGGSVAAGQAVVMNTFAFGSGAGCPGFVPDSTYGLGRTVTHELGHFYNLAHTFADYTCTGDDGLADTPNINDANFGCPTAGSVNGCVTGEKALTMNYMDYVDDACMYMFSEGQATVVDSYLSGVLASQFNTNVASCYTGPQFNLAATNSPFSTCTSEDVDFEINYQTTDGFSETTTFTFSGEPAGTTVTFNPNTISGDGNVTMSVTGVGSLGLGTYPIQVIATSTSVTKEITVIINVTDGACASVGNETDGYFTSVTGVIFNSIDNQNNNPGGGVDVGYTDYTNLSTSINRESSYDLSVYVNTDGNYPVGTVAWVDWNQNCDFTDPGEEYNLGVAQNVANGQPDGSPISITVPSDAVLGNTVMRVATQFNAFPIPCANGHDAEVEDYTINILASLSVDEFSLDGFVVYPNPNNGSFNLKLENATYNNIDVIVYDIRGRVVYSQTFKPASSFNKTIDLNGAESGVYLLQVSDGNKTKTKKIIVE